MRKRRKFSRDFKLSLLREHENGKSEAQICRENDIHPALFSRWRREYKENPESAFKKGKPNQDAKIAELERLVGQLYAENEFLKKALSTLETRLKEQREKNGRR